MLHTFKYVIHGHSFIDLDGSHSLHIIDNCMHCFGGKLQASKCLSQNGCPKMLKGEFSTPEHNDLNTEHNKTSKLLSKDKFCVAFIPIFVCNQCLKCVKVAEKKRGKGLFLS